MPIRRLNYTKRRKLTRDHIRIRLSPDDMGHYATHWLKFCRMLPGMAGVDLPPAGAVREQKNEWIDRAVRSFAKHTRLADAWIVAEDDS